MTTKTETMRTRARAALESAPPIQPPRPPETVTAAVPEPDPRLSRILEMLAPLAPSLSDLRSVLERTLLQTDYTPPAVEACARAQENAAKASDGLRSSILRLEDQVRRIQEAAQDICEHGEGRLRRMAVSLFVACTLPGTAGTLWLAWRANLI